jgi:hypothetical protein
MNTGIAIFCASLLIGTAAAEAAQAGTPQWCPDLKRTVAAAAETPSFNSVSDASGHGMIAFGGLNDCNPLVGVSFSDKYICQSDHMAPEATTAMIVGLQQDIAACLGVAGAPGNVSKNEMRFTMGGTPAVTVGVIGSNAGDVAVITVSVKK